MLRDGLVTFGRTLIDPDELIERTATLSAMPTAREWLEEYVRKPATDREVIDAFGTRDGRNSEEHARGESLSKVLADLKVRGLAQIDDRDVVLATNPVSGLPVLSIGRRVTSADVADALDDE